VVGGSPADLAAYVAAGIPKWAALAHQAGVQPNDRRLQEHERHNHS
jgi:hypothetical protein